MNISPIAAQTQQQTTGGPQQLGNQEMGKDEFLKLLVAQMKNQDPINPMDGTKFASQLAQFNSVEQLINLNDGIQRLSKSQQMMNSGLNNTMAASLTGKSVRAMSSRVGVMQGQDTEIQFQLNGAASKTTLTITDSAGNIVRSEELGGRSSGDHSWSWDGASDSGARVPNGTYTVDIKAENPEGAVTSLSFIEGTAEKVHYTSDGVELMVNGVYVPLGDVEEIGI
ncbi:flagellar hook assembly protein FlgD [Fodinibius sediminis]|uniref:Basal-body rod modification protein FlgD n=1 Tax=Fodinibius sediminis TaxID=1214077 RepID=A0A521CJ03_9BACT|nr:flagellar hook capping FlgD N-terminal domain-containing protein [Fodinibius sediminis]SMO59372.1 flagellar basal-body rod modification protein FlgD [Fodinibius sediminis]